MDLVDACGASVKSDAVASDAEFRAAFVLEAAANGGVLEQIIEYDGRSQHFDVSGVRRLVATN